MSLQGFKGKKKEEGEEATLSQWDTTANSQLKKDNSFLYFILLKPRTWQRH